MVSMPGVFNVFAIMSLIMGIWAIMGTDLYRLAMAKYFPTFLASGFTMFQCMTGDAWSRIMWDTLYTSGDWFASVFFTLYALVICIIMLNIVMARLLDRFLDSYARSGAQESPQDPMMAEAMHEIAVGFRRRGCSDGFRRMWSVLRGLREMERLQHSPTAARQRQARRLFAGHSTHSSLGQGTGSTLDRRRSSLHNNEQCGSPRSNAPDPPCAPAEETRESARGVPERCPEGACVVPSASESPPETAGAAEGPVFVSPEAPSEAAGQPPGRLRKAQLCDDLDAMDLDGAGPMDKSPWSCPSPTPAEARPPDDDLQHVVELILHRLAVVDVFIAEQQSNVLSAMEGFESRLEQLEKLWQSWGGEIEEVGAATVGESISLLGGGCRH